MLGEIAEYHGRRRAAWIRAEAALAAYMDVPDAPDSVAAVHLMLGRLARIRGDLQRAHDHASRAHDGFDSSEEMGLVDVELGLAAAELMLGELSRQLGDRETAGALLMQAKARYAAFGATGAVASAAVALGALAADELRVDDAHGFLAEALQIYEEGKQPLDQAHVHRALGDLGIRAEDDDCAARHLQLALDLYRSCGEAPDVAFVYDELGDLAIRQRRFVDARGHLQAALAIHRAADDRFGQANSLRLLGVLAFREGDLEVAAERLRAAGGLYDRRSDRASIADVRVREAELAIRQDRTGAARAKLERARTDAQAVGAQRLLIEIDRLLGDLAVREGKPQEAQERLSVALERARSFGAPRDEADVRLVLGQRAQRSDALPEAREQFERALAIYRRIRRIDGQAHAHLLCAELAIREDAPTGAEDHGRAALELYEQLGDGVGVARAQTALGVRALLADEVDESERLLLAALAAYEGKASTLGPAEALLHLGQLASALGKLPEARVRLEAALRHYEIARSSLDQANTHDQLGKLALTEGDSEAAERHARLAFTTYVRLEDRLGQANASYTMSEIALSAGALREAIDDARRALRLYTEIDDRMGRANSHCLIGALMLFDAFGVRGHPELALAGYRQARDSPHESDGDLPRRTAKLRASAASLESALDSAQRIGDRLGAAAARLNLGAVSIGLGRYTEAREHLTAASTGFSDAERPRGQANAKAHLAHLHRLTDEPATALPHVAEAVEQCERLRALGGTGLARLAVYRDIRSIYLLAIGLAVECADDELALRALEAARADALAAALRLGPSATDPELDPELAAALEELDSSEHALAQLTDDSGQTHADSRRRARTHLAPRSRRRRDGLLARRQTVLRRIEELTSHRFMATYEPSPANPRALLAAIDPGAHALIYELDDREPDRWECYTLWVPPDRQPVELHRVELVKRSLRLLKRYARLPDAAASVELDGWGASYEELAADLLPPGLRERLVDGMRAGRPRQPLVIVPAGPLWALPFEGLRLGDQPLVAMASVTRVPSLGFYAALERTQSQPGTAPARALAYLHEDLGGEEEEARALERYFGLERIEDSDGFVQALQDADHYRILHLAAHGTAERGLGQQLELSSRTLVPAAALLRARLPKLVTLGACWGTAVRFDPGTEPLGLATICLTSGAQLVIGGTFAVESRGAASILAAAYARMADGQSPPAALAAAQTEFHRVSVARGRGQPFYWAGLTSIGRSSPSASDEAVRVGRHGNTDSQM